MSALCIFLRFIRDWRDGGRSLARPAYRSGDRRAHASRFREPIRTLDAIHLASIPLARSALAALELLSLDDSIRNAAWRLGVRARPDYEGRQPLVDSRPLLDGGSCRSEWITPRAVTIAGVSAGSPNREPRTANCELRTTAGIYQSAKFEPSSAVPVAPLLTSYTPGSAEGFAGSASAGTVCHVDADCVMGSSGILRR